MIQYTTSIENNLFYVRFNLSPQDVKCSRSNYTAIHKGAGTTSRQGIWEGVELHRVYGRVNSSNPWVDLGKSVNQTLHTHQNGDTIQLKAIYRIKTMGYHWQCKDGTYPFFYYGNIGGDPNRYVHGHFTDHAPGTPTNSLHSIHAVVPVDWKHVGTGWSDWAYFHAKSTSNYQKDYGNYEQRNGKYEGANSNNGWISDSGWAQMWRKSCMFTFEKEFSVNIVSSGIVKDASTPELSVHAIKGDSGRVTVKYIDKYGSNGRLRLRAYCNDKQVEILTYDNSSVFANGNTKEFNINFVETFGENYRGNDIQYEAWAKNSHDKQSAGTGRKGGHRFNGRPSIPNGLFVQGHNKDIIYDNILFSWNASNDPEKDSLSYDLHLTVVNNNGVKLKESIIAEKVNDVKYHYNIINDADNCNYILKIRAFDGLIYSDWSQPLSFKKGAKPTGSISLISPERDSANLYCVRPRFTFKGYDNQSVFVVVFNNKEYDTINNADMFAIDGDKVMFCISNANSTIKLKAYMKNEYGASDKSNEYFFNYTNIESDLYDGDYPKASSINKIIGYIQDKGKAYNIQLDLENTWTKETIIQAKIYNRMVNALNIINNKLNDAISSNKFNTNLVSTPINRGVLHDESIWNQLFTDIKNI